MIPVSIKNAPLLAQLEIGGFYCNCLLSDLSGLLLVHPCQLETIVLDLNCMSMVDAMKKVFLRGFVEFSRVKYLELRVFLNWLSTQHSIPHCLDRSVCPCLQIFRLEVTNYALTHFHGGRSEDLPHDLWKRISQRKPTMADISYFRAMDPNFPLPSRHHHNQNFLYQCLETVELVGFSGHPAELELAIYLLENAALRLQRITIDPHTQHFASDAFLAEKVLAARESEK